MTRASRSQRAWARWRGLVEEQERSGLSVHRFCMQRGLSASSMFAWRRKLREAESGRVVQKRSHTIHRSHAIQRSSTVQRSHVIRRRRTPRGGFVEVFAAHERGGEQKSRAAHIDRVQMRHNSTVAVELLCGRRIVLGPGFDRDLLLAVIETLEHAGGDMAP